MAGRNVVVRAGAFLLAAFPLAAMATATTSPAAPLQVQVVDVEGGSATLYVTPEGRSVLIDAGWPDAGRPGGDQRRASSAERIAAAARGMGVERIDYLIVTHFHDDHAGGVTDLLTHIPVGTIIDHGENRESVASIGQPADSPAGRFAQTVEVLYARYLKETPPPLRRLPHVGDTLRVDDLFLTFVASDGEVIDHPLVDGAPAPSDCSSLPSSGSEPGENFRSIGVVASFGATRILSLGDGTRLLEGKLVCPVNKLGPIDLFVVSHHGASQSNSAQLLEAITPRVALLGNGARKGGDREVFETIAATPSKPALWQLHSALRSPEADRPSRYVANLGAGIDAGYSLKAMIWKDGRMRVTNVRNDYSESYGPARD